VGQSRATVGVPLMGEAIPRCHCTLPLTVPPAHVRIWDTDRDPDPGLPVTNVVRWGDEPHMRRWVRRTGDDTDKWDQKESLVDGYHEDDTPPSSWPELGRCFIDRPHLVYAVRRTPSGKWMEITVNTASAPTDK
jgi:hypothetical protein